MTWLKAIIITAILILCLSVSLYSYDTLKISAELDSLNKQVKGFVDYELPSGFNDRTFELQLFPNVFSSEDSRYFKYRPEMLRRFRESKSWGGMQIDSVFIGNNKSKVEAEIDYTRAAFNLDEVENTRDKLIRVYFTTIIPGSGDRLSYTGGDYVLDGWFPFPAVFKDGEWYNPDYNSFAELVSDFYYYDVTIAIPANCVVAASCPEENAGQRNKGHRIYHYLFGPAHDFALAVSPDYLIEKASYDDININIYYRDFEQPMVARVKNAVLKTLEYMSDYVGPLEYKNVNYAFCDIGFAGGIEFPGLIALTSPRGGLVISNAYEELVIHETVHQWFYGMVGSDQSRAPWMDESVTNLFTLKILEKYWGREANLLNLAGFKLSERDNIRLRSPAGGELSAVNQPTASFISGGQFYNTIYYRGTLALETFDSLLGDSLSSVFWKNYFKKYKFKHVADSDFINLTGELAGDTIRNTFENLLGSPVEIDYSVSDLRNRRIDSVTYDISFVLSCRERLGVPVDYAVCTVDGDTLFHRWRPGYNVEEINIKSGSPAVAVFIDPNNTITIDANLLNNSVCAQPDNKPGFRLSSGLMFLLESLFSFIGGI